MTDEDDVAALARDLVRIDSRSPLSNLAIAERVEAELADFEVERLDYTDAAGTAKRALVAHRGGSFGLALSGHMDTVPETGWSEDPWSGRIADGRLHGLGSTDMKGPVAACIIAARGLPHSMPVTLLITADEETTKAGANAITTRSVLARTARPRAILVAEPTRLCPVRGHRSHVQFTAVSTGIQAHSSTGAGRNANWALVPFLVEMQEVYARLRGEAMWQDAAYDPTFSDFNLVLDNHGTASNVSVPKATARIKFRYSRSIDPGPIVAAVTKAAEAAGLTLEISYEAPPPELPADHPLIRLCVEASGQAATTAPYGTDASELQAIAPCVVLGPGDIAMAHRPQETVAIAELAAAIPLFRRLAERVAALT